MRAGKTERGLAGGAGVAGYKEGKEKSSYPLPFLPSLAMCWAADEEMEKVLETPSHLLTNRSARLVETGWRVKAPTACSHLCFAGIMAVGEEGPGGSWPSGLADTASLRSRVSMTHLWPQPHAACWPSAALHGLSFSPRQPCGGPWVVYREGCGHVDPGPALPRAQNPLEDYRFRGRKVDPDHLSHCCQQGFQGNSLLRSLSLHGNVGCGKPWQPNGPLLLKDDGVACGVCPQYNRTLKVTQFLAQPQGGHRKLHLGSLGSQGETGYGQSQVSMKDAR